MAAGGNWKEMFSAAEQGDLELVRYHLSMGVDPNYQHPEYMTGALLESIRKGNLEVAKLLLEHDANPNIIKDFGTETPMSIAIAHDNKAAIYLLNDYLPQDLQNKQVGRRRKILITGGNRGIGKAIAQNLLSKGHEIVISVRKKEDGDSVTQELKAKTANPNISFIEGNLSNIQACQQLIERIKTTHPDLNVLINNAGVWMLERELNQDGLEKSFMVNYLAPYLLCKGLLPLLQKNQAARIVNVNSGLYIKGKLDVEKTPYGLDFHQIKTYATSKLCNVMFTIDFAQEIAGSGVTINAVHPGVINTGLGDGPKLLSKIVKLIKQFWKSPAYGADASTWLATDKDLQGVNGNYYNERAYMEYTDAVKDDKARAALRLKTESILYALQGD